MPYTIGRGYCAVGALRKIAQRFADSGKEHLILLALADHDPDGMCIVPSVGKTMLEHAEDLIEPENLKIVRVALNISQVTQLKLNSSYDIDTKSSSRRMPYEERFNTTDAWELEAAKPPDIEGMLERAILTIIDIDAYNHEVEQQNADNDEISDLKAKVGPGLAAMMNGEST